MATPEEVRELLQPVLEPPTVDFNFPKTILNWLSLVFGLVLMVGLTFLALSSTTTTMGPNGVSQEVNRAGGIMLQQRPQSMSADFFLLIRSQR